MIILAKLIEMLKNQAGRLSIGRVCSVVTFCLWVFTWMYTLFMKQAYAHFDVVTVAMLIMFFVVIMSKTVDSRLLNIKVGDK